jgi:hypothetical protein
MDKLSKIDRILVLLALRAKLRGLEPSISDYHRDIKKVFNYSLCYGAVRNHLRGLEEQGFLKSELVKGLVKNDLVDSKGIVKLRRHTRVYKKVYSINEESKDLKQLIKDLKASSKLFNKKLHQIFCNDELLNSLA